MHSAMSVLVVGQTEVQRLLPMDECMDAMEKVLASLARGEALLPLRTILWLPEKVGGGATTTAASAEDQVILGLMPVRI